MNMIVVNPLCEKVPAIQILEAIDRLNPDINPVLKCVKYHIIMVLRRSFLRLRNHVEVGKVLCLVIFIKVFRASWSVLFFFPNQITSKCLT